MSDPNTTSNTNPAAKAGNTGIFSMSFREVGRFCEESYSWGENWVNKLLDAFQTDSQPKIESDRDKQRRLSNR